MSTTNTMVNAVPVRNVTPDGPFLMKHLVAFTKDGSSEISAEFRIGVRSVPYLADHGFQDMIILPGALYIEMALSVEWKLREGIPRFIRKVRFDNPVILSAEDTVINVEVSDLGKGCVEYAFYEASTENAATRRYAATLEIDRRPAASLAADDNAFSIESFQQQSDRLIGSKEFYKALGNSGNHYGPSFQNISSIWRLGDQCLGKLSVPRQEKIDEPHRVHPSLLDSMTQLLASFTMENGKTFILRSIGEIDLIDLNFPDTVWAHAIRLQDGGGDDNGFVGNIRVSDQSCRPYLRLSDVAFTFLEHLDSDPQKASLNFVVAANFTAEPLEDVLKYWGEHFGVKSNIEFTPYNQVFQQLLDTGSAFQKNSDGVNVILLALEEWIVQGKNVPFGLNKSPADRRVGSHARYVLPNGLEIAHLNAYETDYLYKEIFEDQCYLRHGIRFPDRATVVDIGANIGMFSLFVMSRCTNPRIYAFEPAPVVYDLLKANFDAYGSNVRAFNLGVSDKPKAAMFTFYEKSSVFSGFHSNESDDREAIQAVVRNMLNSQSVAGESMDEYVNELIADRLLCTTHECQLTSVSALIRENRIEKIDLLKIDAEKSELDIIRGIADDDWEKIDQIVIEIHDRTKEFVKRIEDLLIRKGYRCAVEQEKLLEHAGFYNLYASRDDINNDTTSDLPYVEAVVDEIGEARQKAGSLKRNVQEFCAALRSFMNQTSVPLVLCLCPRSPAAEGHPELKIVLDDAEAALLTEAATIANVHSIPSTSLLQQYSVNDYYDSHSHHLANIPYTPEGYAIIATVLVRTIFNLKRDPFKVIVLDCDNTLWKGVCGEDGPSGIEVTAAYRTLQEFMIGQMNAGMLLCLCSKNNENDALDVLDQRTDMPLKCEHLVSWRINWNSKSENIKSLAKELNLGLDSFIFIDDNPIDCADVKINCPGVLVLQLPEDTSSFGPFLNHIWAFDHSGLTEEDRNRTKMYQEGAKRQQYLEQSLSLKDFIKGLELGVDITEATEDQLGRISQQTFRTNQFNFTTIRRSENDLENFLKRENAHCVVVRVVDRFGDYGLVGVLMYEIQADHYKVDTFLLSCRVLGRGVEHAVVAWLGRKAIDEGKRFVDFTYVPTGKNLPALEFIASIGEPYRNESATSWAFPAERLALVEYNPDENAPIACEDPVAVGPEKLTSRSPFAFSGARSDRMQRIGEYLYDIKRLTKAVEDHRLGQQLIAVANPTSANNLETALTDIWRKVLGRPHIGMNDNFFEVGGTSLRAVQVIAMIQKELKQTVPIVSLFECPTLTLLAAKLNGKRGESHGGTAASAAAVRGQQRRYNTARQRAS